MDETENSVKEGSSQSPSEGSLNSNDNHSMPSAEDLEWANSCLVKTEASNFDLSSFEESLSEILYVPLQAEPVSLLAAHVDNNDGMELGDNHTFSYGQNVEAALSMTIDTVEGEGSTQEEGDNDVDVSTDRLKKKWLKDNNWVEDVFLPGHAEFAELESGSDGLFDLIPLSFEPETSTDSIFKVWDLEFFVEQDEFSRVWSSGIEEPKSGVADGLQDVVVEPMDLVIDGISGLSLH